MSVSRSCFSCMYLVLSLFMMCSFFVYFVICLFIYSYLYFFIQFIYLCIALFLYCFSSSLFR